jgi:hypothetical protein
VEPDHDSMVRREPPKGGLDHRPGLGSAEAVARCRDVDGGRVEGDLTDAPIRSQRRPAAVRDDPVEPRLEPLGIPETSNGAPGAEERVLDDVLGTRITDDRGRKPVGRRGVSANELLEGIDVSAACPHDRVQAVLPSDVQTYGDAELFGWNASLSRSSPRMSRDRQRSEASAQSAEHRLRPNVAGVRRRDER